MKQKTREAILAEVTSDHLPQMFEIKLSSNSESDESSSTEKTKVNIVTWNILNQCKVSPKFSNNPWNYHEPQEDFKKRFGEQAKQLHGYIEKGVDIFCLQECSEEAARKIKKKLNESGGDFQYETLKKTSFTKKPKQSYTFYNKKKFNLKESKETIFSTNIGSTTEGIHLGLAITFEDTTSKQNFVVENVHGLFDRVDLVEKNSESLKEIYSDIPVISVGDYNIDASKLSKQERVQTFACGLATNFDAETVRGEKAVMKTENKCYDMAHIILPEKFRVGVKATYQHFTENLEIKEIETIEAEHVTTESIANEKQASEVTPSEEVILKELTLDKSTSKTNFTQLNSPAKSSFSAAGEFKKKGHFDFFGENTTLNKEVPVAITGSINYDLFWQIGGDGVNGALKTYLESKKGNALENANQKLKKEKLEKKLEEKDPIGEITLVDLELKEKDAQIQTILYSASPNLSGLDKEQSENAMVAFGKKFRDQLSEQKIKELYLPLYSGGIYKGSNEPEKVAEWLMKGWFLAEKENSNMGDVKVYLGHKCLVDAVKKVDVLVEKKTSKPLSTSEASDNSKILAEGKSLPKEAASKKPNLENLAKITSQKEMEAKIMLGNIKEKIFANPNGTDENLSAEDVAIRKCAWLKGTKSLEYAANSVLNKAKKAAKNDTREVVEGGEKSKEAWYKRFTRTDFKQVDLSDTFRTVFVNCTFNEECVLPKDPSSIDPKYFLNCEFSKVLMDKPENEALKSALENAGMKLDEDSGFYKIDNVERKKYAEKDKKGEPNSNFKPIESFQLISNYKDKLNKTK